MELIGFKVTDKGKEYTIFINPEYIELILVYPKLKDKTKIYLASGNKFTVNHSLDEVNELLGIEKIKRTARRIT